ncbi:MAG: DUF4926 domain-containing protein [Candidatus Woykebacteria bacterium]
MFKELDTVVLTHDIKDHSLEEGDIGTVVHTYGERKAVEVEVVKADGTTVAVLTLEPKDVRNITRSEILKVREFATI